MIKMPRKLLIIGRMMVFVMMTAMARMMVVLLPKRMMVRITMRKRHCTDAPSLVAGKDKVEAGHETRHPSHATGNNNLVSEDI